ncbi:CinA family protein [Sporichthya polymorpha]|uniref:CinA family protein n=1 Tax=Sporichthya polymorpha TaxID=35751 RepID=UPI000375F91B|nr:CinA family protein [Sporichthya polymorpha]
MSPTNKLAEEIAALAEEHGHTVATAESLTGGQLTVQLAAAPNASSWFRGGVVAYSSEVKRDVLDVPLGPVVSKPAAMAMASGACRVLGARIGVSTTGVGGPGEEEGQSPGTVWIGLAWEGIPIEAWEYKFGGDPDEICQQACEAALQAVRDRMHIG